MIDPELPLHHLYRVLDILAEHKEHIEESLYWRGRAYDSDFIKILKEPRWKHRTDWLLILAGRANWDAVTESEFRKVIEMEHWQNNPELRKLSGGANPDLRNISGGTLRQCADYLKDWARRLYHGRKSRANPQSSVGSH